MLWLQAYRLQFPACGRATTKYEAMIERHKVKLQRQIGKGAFGVLFKG